MRTQPSPGRAAPVPLGVLQLEDRVNPGSGTFTAGRFDFSVAVLFNASAAQLMAIRDRFQAGSDILADSTDGQHRFGTVTILNNAGTTAQARAEYWITDTTGRANATLGLYGIPGAHINMFFPSNFVATDGGDNHTIAHEFGHHAYGLADEYSGPDVGENAECAATDSATLNFSIMDNYRTKGGRQDVAAGRPYTLNEFCVASNHDPDGDTYQTSANHESAWETVSKSRFPAVAPAGLPVDLAPPSAAVSFTTVANASDDLLQLQLLIDRSGSMAGERIQYAIGGARGLARGAAGFNPNVGLTSFSDAATVNAATARIGTATNLNTLLNAISNLATGGQTNIGGGLQAAAGQIPPGGTSSRANEIVLLSDGDHNVGTDPSAVIPLLRSAGISVLAIGVGTDLSVAGEAALQRIGRETGGSYIRVRDNSFGLLGRYFTKYGVSTGADPVTQSPIQVGDGRSDLTYTTPVEAGAKRADFLLALQRNIVSRELYYDVFLTSPSGVVYRSNTAYPSVAYLQDDYLSGFRVTNPEAGNWVLTARPTSYGQVNIAEPTAAPTQNLLQFQGLVQSAGTGLTVAVVNNTGVYPAPVTVTAVPYYRNQPVVGSAVSGVAVRPDGSRVPVTLFDDGDPGHGDQRAGDGVYSALFNRYSDGGNGTYQFELSATTPAGAATADGEAALYPDDPSNSAAVPAFTRSGTATAVVTGVPATVPAAAQLAVKLIPPAGGRDGKPVTYQAVVTNTGATAVTNALVDVRLPGGVKIVSVAGNNGTATVDGKTVRLTIPQLGAGQSATAAIVVIVGPEAAGGTVGASATASSADQVVDSLTDAHDQVFTAVRKSSQAERLPDIYAVGAGPGGGGQVRLYNADGSPRPAVEAFPAARGGARTATADFTGDGVPDLVVGTGPGVVTRVRVIDGATGAELFSVQPFEDAFTGGVYVAAGDITGDGVADLVITPDEGGGPRVRVFSGTDFAQVADFFGIDDEAFRGGARASVGDMTGDGVGDLVVAAGFGGGPRVTILDGSQVAAGGTSRTPGAVLGNFFAYEEALRNGAFASAGDVDGDGRADLLFGAGPGGGPRVRVFSGTGLLAAAGSFRNVDELPGSQLANFFAGDPANRGGIRVALKNLDDDARADLVTGSGVDGGSRVTAYRGSALSPAGTPPELYAFDSAAGFTNGVFVG